MNTGDEMHAPEGAPAATPFEPAHQDAESIHEATSESARYALANDSSAAPVATRSDSPVKQRGIVEWFWRGRAVDDAYAALRADHVGHGHLRRARCAAELGDRAAEEIDPPKAGSPIFLAVSLYREATYWALLASRSSTPAADESNAVDAPRSLAEVFEQAATTVDHAAGGPEGAARVRHILIEKTLVDTAAQPTEDLQRDAREARSFVHALLTQLGASEQRVGKLLFERVARLAALVLAIAAIAAAVAFAIDRAHGPNLIAGRPFRASSIYPGFAPAAHRVDGHASDIFFHTEEEESPWVQYDLGAPRTISRVDVTNRGDCCSERVVPLVVETSNDQAQWAEVARRTRDFRTWSATFEPRSARYVRLRVPRKTWLHLENVAVR